jgi:hypothetical protein
LTWFDVTGVDTSQALIRRSATMKRFLSVAMALALLAGLVGPVVAGGILPPRAKPHGYTLADMARAVALFTTSGNDPDFYPDTPFQILFADPDSFAFELDGDTLVQTGSNTFTVKAGTPFYMPMFNADDSPPVFGNFPTTSGGAVDYVFDAEQFGLEDFEVVVDGQATDINEAYLVGPIQTPPLNEGGGTHIITLGVFLPPLPVGTHTVSFSGQLAGDLISQVLGFDALAGEFTYTVNVVP